MQWMIASRPVEDPVGVNYTIVRPKVYPKCYGILAGCDIVEHNKPWRTQYWELNNRPCRASGTVNPSRDRQSVRGFAQHFSLLLVGLLLDILFELIRSFLFLSLHLWNERLSSEYFWILFLSINIESIFKVEFWFSQYQAFSWFADRCT